MRQMRNFDRRADAGPKKLLFFSAVLAAMLLVGCSSEGSEATISDADAEPETVAAGTPGTDEDVHEDEDHDHDESIESGELDLLGDYSIEDSEFGTIVNVTIDEDEGTRTIVSNAIPDHETGDFPNEANPNEISEQEESHTFPLAPEYVGEPTPAQVPAIAFNGVKFQPGTAERATCDNGITYNIQAVGLADLVGIPEGLDFNNAHVQPWGEYHYHGTPQSVVDNSASNGDLAFLGFAADGHMVYYSQSNAYSSSYRLGTDEREGTNCVHEARSDAEEPVVFGPTKDGSLGQDWDFDESYGDLDECNGITIDGEYLYLVTDAYPYVSRCMMGAVDEASVGDEGGVSAEGDDRPERPAPGDDDEAPAEGDDRP